MQTTSAPPLVASPVIKKVEYLPPLIDATKLECSASQKQAPHFTTLSLAGYLTITDQTGEQIYLQAIGPRIWTDEHTALFRTVRDTLITSQIEAEKKLALPLDIEIEPDLYS